MVFILLQMTLGKSWVLASQTVSFACGFIVSFLLNRSWVFRSSGDMKPELLKYILVAGINLFAGNLAILFLTGPAELNQYVSKLLVMMFIAGWNYLIFSKLVFKQRIRKV